VFPQYTPHDATRHLEQLFLLADRVLGADLYDRLNFAELSLLVFALYAHDWGMAISDADRAIISGAQAAENIVLIPDEARRFQRFRGEALRVGNADAQIWEDYLRDTHAVRSGYRLRRELAPLSQTFAEMVARAAEGHVLDIRDIRDPERYPLRAALFGQVANVAAVATYVRLVDLLDLAEDRTPFALWSMVRPANEISRTEWKKHRSLAPIAVSDADSIRRVLISGTTADPDVFAALADLRSWVDAQFGESVSLLHDIGAQYDPKLDSAIKWEINAVGFEPVLIRFDFARTAALALLSTEVYRGQTLTFIRELMQNSVDALDTRVELLRQSGAALESRIAINITTLPDRIKIEWNDNGVGMDRFILDGYFAKVGRSWYQSPDFRRHSFTHDPISRFGVGFLSCFAVSNALTVITRREPLLARDPHGWHAQIPSRDSHFRVRVDDHAPVGTTIILEVDKPQAGVTAAAIATAIKRSGQLVRYRIELSVDGSKELIEPVASSDDPRLPFVHFTSLDEAALASLRSLTVQCNHRYLAPDGGYEAFFSCLLPRDLSSVTSLKSGDWDFVSASIDFDDFIMDMPTSLFLKGVASDADSSLNSPRNAKSLALNILKPSLVRPDLSRARAELTSVNLDGAWSDFASHLRAVIGSHSESIERRAWVLSVASLAAGVPDRALSQIVEQDSWPIWSLEAGSGLSWRDARVAFCSDEVIEAPDELSLIVDGSRHASAIRAAKGWGGPKCFVSSGGNGESWWVQASSLSRVLLEARGFAPVEVRFVNGPSDDIVPLVTPVWRKQAKHPRPSGNLDLPSLLDEWRKDPMMECPDLIRHALGSARYGGPDAPLLVRFPEGMQEFAAVGSLYWNQRNTKIRALLEMLLELSVRRQRGGLSGRSQHVLQYVNNPSYLGYSVPARHSGPRAAIHRYRELVVVAREERLPAPEPLCEEDFLAGSVGKYGNPYHYPIESWSESHRPVGMSVDTKQLKTGGPRSQRH